MNAQKGFSHIAIVCTVAILGIITFTGWRVYQNSNKQTSDNSSSNNSKQISNFEECVAAGNPVLESYPEKCTANGKTYTKAGKTEEGSVKEERISDGWLLRESGVASIRVPDGFNILVPANEPLQFVLPDVPVGTLKYEKGTKAQVVGEPHKHFELGLMAGINSGWNERGQEARRFKTYDGKEVVVNRFYQENDPEFLDFSKGTTLLQYKITQGDDSFRVDYAYMGGGIVDIVDEMVKTISFK